MKRKMIYAGVSWAAGMFMASVFPADLQIPAVLFLMLVSAFFFLKAGRKFSYCALSFIFLLTGMTVYTLNSAFRYERIRSFAGQEITFSGKVTEINDCGNDKTRYRLRGKINSETKADIICFCSTMDCDYSDTVSFICTPSEFENTFLFKTRDYYEAEGCFIQTDSVSGIKIKENKSFSLLRLIYRYREYTERKIREILPGEEGALITAMLLGDKSGLSDSSEKVLYRCGTGHMMAVSGMHLVLVINILSSFLEKTKLSGVRKFLVTELAIILFVLFSGMSVSVIRAALMMTLICSAGLFGRKTDPLNSLSIAVFLLLLYAPYLIKNSSFLMSVAGTYGASVLSPYLTSETDESDLFGKAKKRITGIFSISVCVFPFTVMFFDEVSLLSPVSDILLIPLCTFSLVCALVSALAGMTDVIAWPFLMAGGLSSKLVLKISSFMAGLSISSVTVRKGFVPVLTLFLAGFVIFTSQKYREKKHVFISLVISAAVFFSSSFVYEIMNRDILTVYHVGDSKSSAVVVSMNGKTDIIDITGNAKSSQYVSRLTDICGIRKIESVSFMKNPYQSMAAFSERLILSDVSHVYVPEGTYTDYGTGICGCEPECFTNGKAELKRENYTIIASEEGEVMVDYCGSTVKCSVTETETAEGCFTQNNIAVRQSASGKTKVYELN